MHIVVYQTLDTHAHCSLPNTLYSCILWSTKHSILMHVVVYQTLYTHACCGLPNTIVMHIVAYQTVDTHAHGLKNNTRLTRFFNPMKKKNVRWRHCQSGNGGPSVFRLLAEMPSSYTVFDLNNRKSGVNRHLRFCQFPQNSEMRRVWVRSSWRLWLLLQNELRFWSPCTCKYYPKSSNMNITYFNNV